MFSLLKAKKGFMEQIKGLVIGLVVLAVVLAVCFLILAQVKANTTVAADGNATAAINSLTTSAATIPGWVSILIVVFIGAIMIGAVMYFGRSKM